MTKLRFLALNVWFPIAGTAACSDDDHCHEEPCSPSPGGTGGTGGGGGTSADSGGTASSSGSAGSSDAGAD